MKTGLLGATLLITSTTIDDAVWLVPYTTSSHLPLQTKIIHGITFICTLEALSLLCIGIYYTLKHGLFLAYGGRDDGGINSNGNEEESIGFITECIGAIICWFIAIFLFAKKLLKRRRKRLQKQQQQEQQESLLAAQPSTYSSLEQSTDLEVDIDNDAEKNTKKEEEDEINTIPATPSIPLVISLTTLGALDEISYFPALIMGKVFTPAELCIGALFAAMLILIVISLFMAQCKPLVDCLDRIPLHGIVGMFAVVLTIGLFL
jgi:hypothetical protein